MLARFRTDIWNPEGVAAADKNSDPPDPQI